MVRLTRLPPVVLAALLGAVVFLAARPASAQIPGPLFDQLPGARGTGMGRAFGAIADDPSAIRINPAGIAQQKSITVGTAYQRNADELNQHTWSVVDSKTSELAAGVSYSVVNDNALGFAGRDYKKAPPYSMLSVAIGDTSVETFRLGLAFHWLRTDTPVTPKARQIYELTAGAIVPFEKFWGLKVAAVGRNLLGSDYNLLARQVDVSGVVTPFSIFRGVAALTVDASKRKEAGLGYGFGGEVEIVKQFRLRLGMRRDPSTRDTFVGGGLGLEGKEGGLLYGYERNLTTRGLPTTKKQTNQHTVELFLKWL